MTKTTKTTKTTKKGGKTAKYILGLAAAATIATTMMPADAEAGWRGRRNWAIGAGVVGGLALGALALGAAAHAQPGYYAAPAYDCYWVKQRRVTWDGFVVVRNVRVCD
jgi:hypothetical protein